MNLSPYHQKQADLSDEEISNRIQVKERELAQVFKGIKPNFQNNEPKIAVLGCGDKRYVQAHRDLFSQLLGKPVKQTTFDISIDHLLGEEGILMHDCTLPLPNAPYDITYAHVLLKFIEPSKHLGLLKNSYDALNKGGIAIHLLDRENYSGDDAPVSLQKLKDELKNKNINFVEVPVAYGEALVLIKPQI